MPTAYIPSQMLTAQPAMSAPAESVTRKLGDLDHSITELLFPRRIARIADLAGTLDFSKSCIPDANQQAKITQAVGLIHEVAMHYDSMNAWGIYAKDDIDCPEVRL